MAQIRASAFSGPTQLMMLRHPFYGYDSVMREGIPIGIDIFTRKLIMLDLVLLKSLGILDSMFLLFIGKKSYGKSALLKILTIRLAMLSFGFNEMRVAINDHKPEGKGMEYDKLADIIGCEPYVMSAMRVNPFDYRFAPKFSNQLSMALTLCGFALTPLTSMTKLMLMAAVYKMYKGNKYLWSPAMLVECVRTITQQDVKNFTSQGREQLRKEHAEILANLRAQGIEVKELQTFEADFANFIGLEDTLNYTYITDLSTEVYAILADVFLGESASLFGNSHSIYEMYGQRALVKQWTGFSDTRGETIMRTLDTNVKSFIIENGLSELLHHIDLDDERHKSIKNPVNAHASAYFSKIARALPQASLSATTQLNDMRPGEVGSELWNLGDGIISDMGGIVVARQPRHIPTLDELQQRYDLTNRQRELLPMLPRYTYMVKLGIEYEPTFMRVFATPLELELMGSDSASERLLVRPDLANVEDLELYAQMHGVRYLGEAA